jgi:enamine deaminase RidA (YjgF/YER057c/UK114 family)
MRKHIYSGSRYEEMAGYARAVVDGRWVFVSGTVGADFTTGDFPETTEHQTEQAMANIQWALEEAGSRLEDIVRVRCYVPNPDDVPTVAHVLKRHLDHVRPTNTTLCVPLPFPEIKVEIEVTALMPEG